jgi:hypothetical protein
MHHMYTIYFSQTIRTEYFEKMKQVQVKGRGGKESAYMSKGEWELTQQIQNKITVLTSRICNLRCNKMCKSVNM